MQATSSSVNHLGFTDLTKDVPSNDVRPLGFVDLTGDAPDALRMSHEVIDLTEEDSKAEATSSSATTTHPSILIDLTASEEAFLLR